MKALALFVVVCAALCAGHAYAAPDAAADAVAVPASMPVPVTIDDAVDGVGGVVKAFEGNHIRLGIAGVITLLVFLWRKLDKWILAKLSAKWLPLVAAGVAFLAAVPQALIASGWTWQTFVWQGLITGAEAMAFWSLIGKHFLRRWLPEKPKADVAP